jgi:hypothetical protein
VKIEAIQGLNSLNWPICSIHSNCFLQLVKIEAMQQLNGLN